MQSSFISKKFTGPSSSVRINVSEPCVYFSRHALSWEAFEPVSKKWMNLPMLNADEVFQLSDKESMAAGTELLVLGKDLFGQTIHKYSLSTNSWSLGKKMNTPRCLFASACLGKTAIFAGGVDESGKTRDTVESYDSETGAWETLPSLIKSRKMCSGVIMDGKFYAIGGSGGKDGKALHCGEEYDFDAKKWRHIPNMSPGGGTGSMAPPLLAVVDNELYAADCLFMKVNKYNKVKNVWENIGRLPERADRYGWMGNRFQGMWGSGDHRWWA
ncbi:galactose oxidase, beta-propeller [Artemisia annua]|uniref:Galactose oxidase, beta-propeller n=1 Tax=Artemisia annua TaxID=35608 RepID=A0A2U1Q0P9_ARTAN|nr:galactose oxidase, beta-propeller [Artemisia annua]